MKLKKVITIIIILIIVLNTLIPTIALATNETNNEVGTGTTNIDNTVNEKEENNNSTIINKRILVKMKMS